MDLKFKPRVVRVSFGEYNPDMGEVFVDVWLNVSREVLDQLLSVTASTPNEEFYGLLHTLWNAGDHKVWPVEDIKALHEHCSEYDPQLWVWLTGKTWEAIMEYRGAVKKK